MYDFLLLVYNGNNLSDPDAKQRFMKAIRDDNLREQDFTGADLSGLDMRALGLSGVSFAGANLSFVNASAADFSGCNLRGARIRYSELQDAILLGAEAVGADFSRTRLSDNVDLRFADLREAKADLRDVDEANLTGAILPWGEPFYK